ncbi:hypothetical protein [Glaciimonas sp. PCH181]|uniref:hypothetical protein n=1 Tax=Glaciimonas sp. PCH181 TaxID=2133943 RepID=UPI000D3AF812|nr:hypothetical protein [Glaciimonas sp. PCH181]PUA17845.1 hypothetical protein C7W93_18480 [Glaciimonas sp. PCH181]
MSTKFILTLLCATALASSAGLANAKGCLKGAAVGGVGGHYAGHHAVLGAVGGCVVGRHMANKKAAEQKAHPAPEQSAPAK